jgi:dGTPase
LNLTDAVLTGLAAHSGRYDRNWSAPAKGFASELAGWADRLAYDAGDLEDALGAQLISPDDLRELSLGRCAYERLSAEFRDRPIHTVRRIICETVQQIVIDQMRLVAGTEQDTQLAVSGQAHNDLISLEGFLLNKVYRHPRIAQTDEACQQIVMRLFEAYRSNPSLLPSRYVDFGQGRNDPLERTIADYISGMTDRFCVKVYRQMFGSGDMLLRSFECMSVLGS